MNKWKTVMVVGFALSLGFFYGCNSTDSGIDAKNPPANSPFAKTDPGDQFLSFCQIEGVNVRKKRNTNELNPSVIVYGTFNYGDSNPQWSINGSKVNWQKQENKVILPNGAGSLHRGVNKIKVSFQKKPYKGVSTTYECKFDQDKIGMGAQEYFKAKYPQ